MITRSFVHYVHLLRQLPYGVLRRMMHKKCRGYETIRAHVEGKYGLEIGGPSAIFDPRHLIPVYGICQTLDLCNFSEQTIWTELEDKNSLGQTLGKQFVAEASNLSVVSEGTYDFVLASHVLEHIANPLRALREWCRVLKADGTIVAVVPHRSGTFDHRRKFTPFEHILDDFEKNVPESDLTHADEILSLHDLNLDLPAGSPKEFKERCFRNASVRAMHHHVFSPETLVAMFTYIQMRVLHVVVERPFHIIVFAQKVAAQEIEKAQSQNHGLLQPSAEGRRRDPIGGLSTGGLTAGDETSRADVGDGAHA